MYRKEGIRWTTALLLVLLLATPALAGERRPGRVGSTWLEHVVQWLVELLEATECDKGISIDPDGRCVAAAGTAAATQCDAGSSIDPDGRCVAATGTAAATQCDKGSSIDPNGGCAGE